MSADKIKLAALGLADLIAPNCPKCGGPMRKATKDAGRIALAEWFECSQCGLKDGYVEHKRSKRQMPQWGQPAWKRER